MLRRLKEFLAAGSAPRSTGDRDEDVRLALATLLAYAAGLDEDFDERERSTILELLSGQFDLTDAEALELLDAASEKAAEATELFGTTRVIRDRYDQEARIEMLEMLWQVVYSDGRLHDHEANLMRRVAGLLHVEDRDSGMARKRVLARLGLQGQG